MGIEIYIYLLFVVVCCLLLIKVNRKLLFLPFVFITLFSGFRKNVGIDYHIYENLYEWGSEGLQVTSEPFFKYFVMFCNVLGGNVHFFFLLSATITSFFIFLFIKSKSQNYILSFLIYFCIISFYLYTMNAVRQSIACSIFLFSLIYLEKKKIYVYIILNLIASLFFHMSLLFIFPLTLFTIYQINSKLRYLGYIFAVIFGLFSDYFMSQSIYNKYEDLEFDATIDFKVYFFLIITVFFEFTRKKYEGKTLWSRILVNINYLSVLFLIILILQNTGTMILLFKRIHNYYFIVYTVFIPYVISCWESRKIDKVVTMFMYFLLPVIYLLTIYFNGEKAELLPYDMNTVIFK